MRTIDRSASQFAQDVQDGTPVSRLQEVAVTVREFLAERTQLSWDTMWGTASKAFDAASGSDRLCIIYAASLAGDGAEIPERLSPPAVECLGKFVPVLQEAGIGSGTSGHVQDGHMSPITGTGSRYTGRVTMDRIALALIAGFILGAGVTALATYRTTKRVAREWEDAGGGHV